MDDLDSLLSDANARLRESMNGGTSGVLRTDVPVLVATLVRFSDEPTVHPDAVPDILLTAGMLSWSRGQAQPPGAARACAHAAADRIFVRLLAMPADRVPTRIREAVAVARESYGHSAVREAGATLQLAMRSGDTAALDRAIDLYRLALPEAEPDQRAGTAIGLATALRVRYERTGTPDDLDEATALAEDVVAAPAVDGAIRSNACTTLAVCVALQADRTGAASGHDRAVELHREAVSCLPKDHVRHGTLLANLAITLRERAGRTGSTDDLDESAAHLQAAIAEAADRPVRAERLASLGATWAAKYQRTGELSLLDKAVQSHTEAVEDTPESHPDHSSRQSNLSTTLRLRFDAAGQDGDIDAAVAAAQLAVNRAQPGDPRLALWLANLHAALLARFERLGARDDLDQAVAAAAESVRRTPPGTAGRARHLSNLGTVLRTFYEETADDTYLAQALKVHRSAVAAAVAGRPDHAAILVNAANTMRTQFERHGRDEDLDEAVDTAWAAVESAAPGSAGLPRYRSNLGGMLRHRYERSGAQADLDTAIEQHRQAIEESKLADRHRARYLSNLAGTLCTRFERTGKAEDLREAVDVARQAVSAGSAPTPDRARCLATLGVVLTARFEQTGALEDLTDGITRIAEAVDILPTGHVDRVRLLTNLAAQQVTLFVRTEDDDALEAAVAGGRAAVEATPEDSPDLPGRLTNLGIALQLRYRRARQLADLDEAIAVNRRALANTGAAAVSLAGRRSNLGLALLSRYEHLREPADLYQAVTECETAVHQASPADPNRCKSLINLGSALAARGERDDSEHDVTSAERHWVDAGASASAPGYARIVAWNALAQSAAGRQDWTTAADAYTEAVRLLPVLAWLGAARTDNEDALAGWAGLASDAAACIVAARRPADEALAVLEEGRAVLWSHLVRLRRNPDALSDVAPELAGEMAALRLRLSSSLLLDDSPAAPALPGTDDRLALAQRWDQLVAQAEEAIGSTPAPATLTLAQDHAVAVLNVSRWRCDALVITHSGSKAYPLPGLRRTDAVKKAAEFLLALRIREGDDVTYAKLVAAERTIRETLGWLWRDVVGPVVETALRHHGQPTDAAAWPRIWWCPTGALSLLPLHAAGDTGGAALDRVVSSYTPSVAALQDRREPGSAKSARSLLAVTVGQAPDLPPLRSAATDLRTLRSLLGDELTALPEERAVRDVVLRELKRHCRVHFGCHGTQDLLSPARARLHLHDSRLTIADLAAAVRHEAVLAVLLACHTATGGLRVPDEIVTLTAALRFAGWQHVIGTLWSVPDDVSAQLAADFYRFLRRDGEFRDERAAEALHHAVRAARARTPQMPSAWCPFVHWGA
ncbi:CHAT domain-containing protein [Amycolatopsis sp. cmx-8-4]|uniref:CHAT domain-containing protein n=1 Tax=Amycolatopsis sp. cmx-8-4 TaxID=2790947 RepID=UPI00397DE3CC